MTNQPVRLPDAASVEAVLMTLDPQTADTAFAPALSAAFPGFSFKANTIDRPYWRDDRTVIARDGARLGDHRAWIEQELAALGGDLTAFWIRHKAGDLQFAEWRGTVVFAFASTGPGVSDFVQIHLDREMELLAGPIVDPDYRPNSADRLFEPSWVQRDGTPTRPPLAGPVYRLHGSTGSAVVHMRSFLARCARIERDEREARRAEMESRSIRVVGPNGARDIPFLTANPGWFDHLPREHRFCADWERSSAAAGQIFEHWAFDIHDYEHHGRRNLGFIPRPLRTPAERVLIENAPSVHRLMERVELLDRQVGLPFAWFFFMTHGQWVDVDVGHAIASGLRDNRVRLPDADAKVLLSWADRPYSF